jgi:hypothetical protein
VGTRASWSHLAEGSREDEDAVRGLNVIGSD